MKHSLTATLVAAVLVACGGGDPEDIPVVDQATNTTAGHACSQFEYDASIGKYPGASAICHSVAPGVIQQPGDNLPVGPAAADRQHDDQR